VIYKQLNEQKLTAIDNISFSRNRTELNISHINDLCPFGGCQHPYRVSQTRFVKVRTPCVRIFQLTQKYYESFANIPIKLWKHYINTFTVWYISCSCVDYLHYPKNSKGFVNPEKLQLNKWLVNQWRNIQTVIIPCLLFPYIVVRLHDI